MAENNLPRARANVNSSLLKYTRRIAPANMIPGKTYKRRNIWSGRETLSRYIGPSTRERGFSSFNAGHGGIVSDNPVAIELFNMPFDIRRHALFSQAAAAAAPAATRRRKTRRRRM